MIKLQALENFTFGRFDELKNIQRKRQTTHGKLYAEDTFECEKDIADYLLNNIKNKNGEIKPNPVNRPVAKVIEFIP